MDALKSKHIPSVVKDLTFIVESYEKKDIEAERAMVLIRELISPVTIRDDVIVKTIAFFWDLSVEELFASSKRGYTNSANYMLRYFIYTKYKSYADAGRRLDMSRESVFNGIKKHKDLLEFNTHYKEIFHVISGILKL